MQAVEGNNTQVSVPEQSWTKGSTQVLDTDTFSISLNYPDPFFNKVAGSVSGYSYQTFGEGSSAGHSGAIPKVSKPKPKPSNLPAQPVAPIDWSFISFMGLIRNSQTTTKVALVNIHQSSHMMKEGETIEGVKLVLMFKDSVQVEYRNEKKTIRKK